MADRIYHGDRTIDGVVVTVDDQPLDPRCDIHTHTDLGFEWTYVGDASRQLALAILMNHLDDEEQARTLTEGFTVNVIANLNNEWSMTSSDVAAAIADL